MCGDLGEVLVGLGLVQQLGGHEADDLVVPQQDIQRVLSSRQQIVDTGTGRVLAIKYGYKIERNFSRGEPDICR